MQQARSISFSSRKRITFSGDEMISFAPACAGSSISASASGATICQGWMWRWTSKTFIERRRESGERRNAKKPTPLSVLQSPLSSRQHHQPHARRCRRAGVLKLAGVEQLRMDLVAIDGLEAALFEVRLGGRGQKIELAQAARGETVEQLPHDPPSDAV